MRSRAKGWIGGLAVFLGLMAQSSAGAASGGLVLVMVDKARVARFPDNTHTVIIGQPGIADVTMLKNTGMGVITGKSFGETNLIALDEKGELIDEWTVRVGADAAELLVQNGASRESYICAPLCLPTVELSDSQKANAERLAAVASHSSFSSGK